MPFARPTLTALIEQAQADVASELQLYALLRFSPERAFALALAGLTHGLYGYLDWIAEMAVPFTARDEYAEAWGALVGIQRKAASIAAGTATFTGTNGAVLPLNTPITRSADGVQYLTTGSSTVAGGVVTVPIAAVEPGAAGNAPAGAALVIGTGVSGVNSTGVVALAATGGADLEAPDDFRGRYLEAFAAPAQGGSESDYIGWAKEVPGVTRAWAEPNGAGAGTVVVYPMFDITRSAFGGLPQGTDGAATDETRWATATGDQLLVANYIHPLRPATAIVITVAPVPYLIALTIADLNDASLRPAIVTALTAFFRSEAVLGGTIYPSDLSGTIKAVPGVTHFSLPVPAAPVQAPVGYLPQLGTATWV